MGFETVGALGVASMAEQDVLAALRAENARLVAQQLLPRRLNGPSFKDERYWY
jgi:hypothetical protein